MRSTKKETITSCCVVIEIVRSTTVCTCYTIAGALEAKGATPFQPCTTFIQNVYEINIIKCKFYHW